MHNLRRVPGATGLPLARNGCRGLGVPKGTTYMSVGPRNSFMLLARPKGFGEDRQRFAITKFQDR